MKKRRFLNHFAVPSDATSYPHFEINGNFQLIADGCLGILQFDETRVGLNCGKTQLEIEGEQLTIRHLSEKEAEVKGKILSVKLI